MQPDDGRSEKNLFALVDGNNFYASCEVAFAPHLRGRPLVVLSNNDGCVVARSPEAKALGISMAAPAFQLRDLFARHGVVVCSSNYTLYADMSRRFQEYLRQFTPLQEVYSIDEIFLDLAARPLGQPLHQTAVEIIHGCRQLLKLPVAIGIAPSRTLSKLANHLAKKRFAKPLPICDLSALSHDELSDLLDTVSVDDLWGVGRASVALLRSRGINTARELRDTDLALLRSLLGINGVRTARELSGISLYPLALEVEPRQSVTVSRSFGRVVTHLSDLEEAVALYCSYACEKLHHDRLRAALLTIYPRSSPHRRHRVHGNRAGSYRFAVATDDLRAITSRALELIRSIYQPGAEFIKAGVLLTELSGEGELQGDLFEKGDERGAAITDLVLRFNGAGGPRKLQFAAAGMGRRSWHTRFEHRSQRYTSSWRELPLVRAGFPSPASDYVEPPLDLNRLLIENENTTFFMRVSGRSMEGAGIFEGDILLVDTSRQAVSGDVVVAIVDGSFLVKRLRLSSRRPELYAESAGQPPQRVDWSGELEIWGVVTCNIHLLTQSWQLGQ